MISDYKNRQLQIGQKVRVQIDLPSADGMLYKDTIVKLDEFNSTQDLGAAPIA